MGRVQTNKITTSKEILRHKDFTAIPVMVDSKSVELNDEGKRIMKAGTIIGGKTTPIIDIVSGLVTEKNDAGAEGVLRNDVDVTNGNREASMIIRGDITAEKLPKPVSEEAREALATRILFIKS